jgi:hypothetical protein
MFANALASELGAIVGVIDPDAYTNSTYTTDYIDAMEFEQFLCIIMVGTMEASSTVDAKIIEYTSTGGAGNQDISGKAITQLTQAGTDSDKQAIINLRREDLDIDDGHRYFKLSVTIGAAASDLSAIVIGLGPRNAPASDNDLSTVDEIVN